MTISNTPTQTITNSFGMPSLNTEYIMQDISKAKSYLKNGQVLVVSVTGDTLSEFIECAQLAYIAGADAIELNFSCPNITSGSSSIYLLPNVLEDYISNIRRNLPYIPLIIKVGSYKDIDLQTKCFIKMASAGANAVSGINSIKMNIPDFARKESGVCGSFIKPFALEFVKTSRKIIQENNLLLSLIGVGGITNKDDIDEFVNAGADFVQCATGFMLDPYFLK
jgi:dihydropyrimidine dehydrogenase (NAD+) subunit PreA